MLDVVVASSVGVTPFVWWVVQVQELGNSMQGHQETIAQQVWDTGCHQRGVRD